MSEEKELYLVGNEKKNDNALVEMPKDHKELNSHIESLVKPGKKPDFYIGADQDYNLEFYQKAKRHIDENLLDAEESYRLNLVENYTDLLFSYMQEDSLEKERIQVLLNNLTQALKHTYR
jgi:hypothetical protein